jgi:hypothetical protein
VQAVGHTGTSWDYSPDIGLTSFLLAVQYGYRKELAGICNMIGVGPENVYTFINTYKIGGLGIPIKIGTVGAPSAINPLYSRNPTELTILNTIYQNLLSAAPYDLAKDQPWIAQDWKVDTWFNEKTGQNCTKVTYWIRKDAVWVTPGTGEPLQPFTAHDFEFSLWYKYAFNDSRLWASIHEVHHTKIIDDYCIEVYFNTTNTRALYWTGYSIPLLYKDRVLDLLCGFEVEFWYQDGTHEYTLTNNVAQVELAKLEGVPLVEGVDYIIKADDNTFKHSVFVPLHSMTGWVIVSYWYPDVPASGVFLAELPWNQTMYSIGPYYPVEIVPPGPSGIAVRLACNPHFFLETPILGEIDWTWWWVGTTKPRSGYYKIGLSDLVMVAVAYGSTGTGVPSPNWFPGADLAAPCGTIGLSDLVTLAVNYGKKFGTPP